MMRKIGRFSGYVPNLDTFDIIVNILSLADFKIGDNFDSPLHKIQHFFYKIKKEYPDLFKHVLFNNDPDLPYSHKIAECFIELQDSALITRPNPSLNKYRISADLSRIKPKRSDEYFDDLNNIAQRFVSEFKAPNENITTEC